jgi:hypothetical protein
MSEPTEILRIESLTDPRITELIELGVGEGFATFTCAIDKRPAFAVDCGTLSEFMEGEAGDSVLVHVFESVDARAAYLKQLDPRALGRRPRRADSEPLP